MVEELITNGKIHWPDYRMPLWGTVVDAFSTELGKGSRFRVILVESGSGIVQLGSWRGGIIAPALICLNETDSIELIQSLDLQARAFLFHPAVINGIFNFENIRSWDGISFTASQDLYWLRPFLERGESYRGLINIVPTSVRRLVALFNQVTDQMTGQYDAGWPCRTRSYFLELLFFVERIFSSPEIIPPLTTSLSSPEVESMLLYLYTHYQSKLTLSELVRKFNSNRTTVTRQFNDTTGMPVMSYLNHLRIQVAAVMLRDTHLNVSEIVERVGFRDATHFVRTFRKQIGYSPTEYRQRYCWMSS